MRNETTCFKENPKPLSKPVFRPPSPVGLERLTVRQREILSLLAQGFYYKEIGVALGISHCTVRAHLHMVYQKLQVNSRARAVLKFNEGLSAPQRPPALV